MHLLDWKIDQDCSFLLKTRDNKNKLNSKLNKIICIIPLADIFDCFKQKLTILVYWLVG